MTLAGPGPTLPFHPDDGTGEETASTQTKEKRPPLCGFFLAVGNEAVKFNVIDEDRPGGVKGWIRGADSSTR